MNKRENNDDSNSNSDSSSSQEWRSNRIHFVGHLNVEKFFSAHFV